MKVVHIKASDIKDIKLYQTHRGGPCHIVIGDKIIIDFSPKELNKLSAALNKFNISVHFDNNELSDIMKVPMGGN